MDAPIDWQNKNEVFGVYYIYALINPIDDSIFYIGRTSNADLRVRLIQHIGHVHNPNKALVNKIQEILLLELKPEIKLTTKTERWQQMQIEGEIISEYEKTQPLLNIQKKKQFAKDIQPK